MNDIISVDTITKNLLEVLDTRSRDIIVRRYGLVKDPETLESIGQEYGITRERVRQIEAQAKKSLAKTELIFAPLQLLLGQIFSAHGGILTEDYLLPLVAAQVQSGSSIHAIRFYLDIMPEYTFVAHGNVFRPHWRHITAAKEEIGQIVAAAQAILEQAGQPQSELDFLNLIKANIERSAEIPTQYYQAALAAAAAAAKTAFGDWGLTQWAEVSPRGVGDKAYTVLRRHGKPEHFRSITQLINKANFESKSANAQTVHNELIKDQRFVLVGRGLYGLREWGFMPGTVADVLESILSSAETPLSREELIDKVLQQRLVKKNTILLGLQNNKRFVKTSKNTYTLRV